MTGRLLRTVIRAVVTTFCWVTALYAWVASSAFAYLQFIKPRVFPWIGSFSDRHAVAAWLWLALLGLLLWPRIGRRQRGAVAARCLMVYAALLAAVNARAGVVAGLTSGSRSVAVGLIALTPVLWLAALDHVVGWPRLRVLTSRDQPEMREQREGRLVVASVGAAVLLTAVYAVLASFSIAASFEPDLLTAGLARGVATSLVDHLLPAAAACALLTLLVRAGGNSLPRQYALVLAAVAGILSLAVARFVGGPLGLSRSTSALMALTAGSSIALTWGARRVMDAATAQCEVASGLDLLLVPSAPSGPSRLGLRLALVPLLAWLLQRIALYIDWDAALLGSGVVTVWLVALVVVYRTARPRPVPAAAPLAVFGLAIAVHLLWHPDAAGLRVLDRYAVHNPSFRLADELVRERPSTSSFDRYLRANTGLTDVSVEPVSIDLAGPLAEAPSRPFPHIFLFVIDSLRADYLAPYNPAVTFTPHLAGFANENRWYVNAFTVYGGTGLSMPAIWAGSALAHKQYVVPFAPMNALEKLLAAGRYQRIQTHDHITEALWTDTRHDVELDRNRTEMDFDFCGTVAELGDHLEADRTDGRPVFAQTRSLDLHVAAVRNGSVPPGRTYPGFEPPYAYRVERIDECFGQFLDRLRRLGLYDSSIVIFTADHGELIGEDGRWGHSYHLFPDVIRVPLLIHLPASDAPQARDMRALRLSTDITPTLYDALGYGLHAPGALAGLSLIDDAASSVRRRGAAVLSASYGAVYAVVSRNARRLYIADAIHGREYGYERPSVDELRWTPVEVTPGRRMLEQLRVRRHVDAVARTYGLHRSF